MASQNVYSYFCYNIQRKCDLFTDFLTVSQMTRVTKFVSITVTSRMISEETRNHLTSSGAELPLKRNDSIVIILMKPHVTIYYASSMSIFKVYS